jgi:hypothetical protein
VGARVRARARSGEKSEPLEVGSLRVHVQEVYGLEQEGDALQSLASGQPHGKVAIAIV